MSGYRILGNVIEPDTAEKIFVERSLKQQKLIEKNLAVHVNVLP